MKNPISRLQALFIILGLLLIVAPGSGQEQNVVDALDLSNAPMVVEFNTAAAGPPTIEPLADGRILFKINAAGSVSGAFEGTMSAAITEVNPQPGAVFQGISISFTIETEQGALEGYYTGTIYIPEGREFADINAHGQILSVSGVYADLFLADVFVASQVQFVDGQGVGESGTMTITSR